MLWLASCASYSTFSAPPRSCCSAGRRGRRWRLCAHCGAPAAGPFRPGGDSWRCACRPRFPCRCRCSRGAWAADGAAPAAAAPPPPRACRPAGQPVCVPAGGGGAAGRGARAGGGTHGGGSLPSAGGDPYAHGAGCAAAVMPLHRMRAPWGLTSFMKMLAVPELLCSYMLSVLCPTGQGLKESMGSVHLNACFASFHPPNCPRMPPLFSCVIRAVQCNIQVQQQTEQINNGHARQSYATCCACCPPSPKRWQAPLHLP